VWVRGLERFHGLGIRTKVFDPKTLTKL
jgi:hypothetical protein